MGRGRRRSFPQSFHQALLQPTRPHWPESPPNLSWLDPTGTGSAEYGQLSPKQQVAGSSPAHKKTASSQSRPIDQPLERGAEKVIQSCIALDQWILAVVAQTSSAGNPRRAERQLPPNPPLEDKSERTVKS